MDPECLDHHNPPPMEKQKWCLRHDPTEQRPSEPHAGRSTFLLSSGGAGRRVLLSGRCYGANSYREPVSLPDASGMSGQDSGLADLPDASRGEE